MFFGVTFSFNNNLLVTRAPLFIVRIVHVCVEKQCCKAT